MQLVKKLTGYKATDKDMKCLDHQFVLGEWYEAEGELVLCKNGFHFCEQHSGPWCYYGEEGTRIFKVEAEEVVRSSEPGVDAKCVARRIRLVEEIFPDGDGNTGDQNTGDRNTGDRNTGNGNATNNSSGSFCSEESNHLCFDVDTGMIKKDFMREFGPSVKRLCISLIKDDEIPFENYEDLPGCTPEKLKVLHEKHITARKKQ